MKHPPVVLVLALAACGIVAVAALFLPIGTRDHTIDLAAFDAAESAYAEGVALRADRPEEARAKFLASAAAFEALLASSDAAGIHFNRANALLEGGRTAEAIAAYLAAERRLRGDPSIADNLAEARSRVTRVAERPEPTLLERLARAWSTFPSWMRASAAASLLWAAAIALALARPRAAAGLVAVGVLVGATLAVDIALCADDSAAVVARETVLRKGNGEGFEPVLTEAIPAGTECRVAETRPGWIEVRCSKDVVGWVREDALLRVR